MGKPELTGKKKRGYYYVVQSTAICRKGQYLKDPPVEVLPHAQKITKAEYDAATGG